MMNSRAHAVARLAILLVLLLLVVSPLRAQNENETVGFSSNHTFDSGHFGENIDILNGGLNLTVPLGPRYQVNSRLGYQMLLSYSSRVWDSSMYQAYYVDIPHEVMPYNEGPAGFGFSLHLGRIMVEQQYMETPPISWYSLFSRTYKWIAPDGSQHEVYYDDRNMQARTDQGVGMVGGNPVFDKGQLARMTTDSSFVLVSGPDDKYCFPSTEHGCYRVRTPDGLVYTLAQRVPCDSPNLPTPFANPQQYSDWRSDLQSFCGFYTTLIEDPTAGTRVPSDPETGPITTPYPNHVKVTYDTRPGFEHVMSRIDDSSGRVLTFSSCQYDATTDDCKIPQDPPPTTPEGKNAMRHSVAITGIDVPGPTTLAGSPLDPAANAHYGLAYKLDPVTRPHPDVVAPNGPVLMLKRIDYPPYTLASGGSGTPYAIYYGYNFAGELSCRTLPVETTDGYSCGLPDPQKAAFTYEWDYYAYVGTYLSNGAAPHFTKGTGVGTPQTQALTGISRTLVTKRLYLKDGVISGTWTYDRGDFAPFTNPTRVKVTDPFGSDTIHYFNASLHGADSSSGKDPDDGLAPDWDDGTNYRIDYFEGPESAGRIVRSETQEYDGDPVFTNPVQRSKNNVRVKRAVTIYIDAGRKEHVVSNSDWDGYGHWEKQAEAGFDVPITRTTRREYANWAGDPQNAVYNTGRIVVGEVSDGHRVFSRTDNAYIFTFNGSVRGLLDYSLNRKTPPALIGTPLDLNARAGDVKTKYTYSSANSGNIIKKELWNDATATSPSYSIRYGWTPVGLAGSTCTLTGDCGGYLATKAFENAGAVSWYAIDRTRDGNTGLIVATRDTAGVQTAYTYDSLGRVKTIAPTGEEITNVDYLTLTQTRVTQGNTAGTDYIYSLYRYDTLGRLVATEKRPADPGPSPGNNSCQQTQYDLANRVTYQTESRYLATGTCTALPAAAACWSGLSALQLTQNPGTEFDFRNPDSGICDPFGRMHKVIPADADPNRVSTDKIARTDYAGLDTTLTVYGIQGPSGTFAAITRYFRDAFNRLIAVDAPEGADAYYDYDALDRLQTVDLTDGQPSNPREQFRRFAYDGLGRMLWAEHPESGTTVFLAYDALGSPLQVEDAKGNVRHFYYDFAGRLVSQTMTAAGRTSEAPIASNGYDEVNRGYSLGRLTTIRSSDDDGNTLLLESRTYSGVGGRLSQVKHDFSPWDDSSAVTTTYAYTARGELASLTYPQESPTTRTVLTVTYTNTNGFVTKATETESNDPTLTTRDLVTFTYNAAGAVQTMTALPASGATGGKTTVAFDVRNRPLSITGGVFDAVAGHWTYESGNYAYDGAGNIFQIGGNSYAYDSVNRLVSAQTSYSSSIYDESYSYDIFGNMTVKSLQASGGSISSEVDTFLTEAPLTPFTNRILNRQTQVGGTTSNPVLFSYDPNGNLVEGGRRGTDGVDIKRYQYGPMNRLLRAQQVISPDTDPSKTSEVDRFAYDTGGNRIWRVEKGTGLQIYSVRDPSGQVLSEFRAPSALPNFVEWAADYIYAGGRLVSMKQNLNPRQPVNLKATQAPSGSGWQVTLNWEPNPEANVKYKVERLREGIDNGFQAFATQPTSATFVDPDVLQTNLGVRYRVSCVDVATSNTSQPSAPVRLLTGDATAPTVPSLSGVSGDRMVSLSWTYSTDASDIAGYELSRRLSTTAPRIPVTPDLIQGTSYVDLNVVNGTTYYYSVRAKDRAGNWSGYSCVPRQSVCDRSVTPKDLAPPPLPKGVNAAATCGAAGGSEKIVVSWDPVPPDCPSCTIYYDVYRSTQPLFDPLSIVATGLTTTSFTDPFTPTPGTVYYYSVRAWDGPNVASNQSPFSEIVGASVRDAGTAPQFRPWAKASEGQVVVRWPTIAGETAAYRVYRRLNVSGSCGDYVLVGNGALKSLGSQIIWEFTDGTVENNIAYDYALTRVINVVESSFSAPILGIPVARTSNLYQCVTPYPTEWVKPGDSNTVDANLVQWTPPNATEYQPLTAGADSLGFLIGYHLYHHKVCMLSSELDGFQDNNPTRELVINGSDPNDRYLLRRADNSLNRYWEYQDPRYALKSGPSTELSPDWAPTGYSPLSYDTDLYGGASGCTSGSFYGSNCFMPKAAYKIFAEGMWLPAESGWPSYFDPYNSDPRSRCQMPIINPRSPGGLDPTPPPYCGDGAIDPNFIPPPRAVSATGSGSSINLSWTPPRIASGKSGLAGYYIYAAKRPGFFPSLNTVRPPLPVATVGPSETAYTIAGLESGQYDLRVASFDDAGHVSLNGPPRCNETGDYCAKLLTYDPWTYCPSLCSLTRTSCDASHPCPNTGNCSVAQTVRCIQNSDCAPQVCSNNPSDPCTTQPPPQVTYVNGQFAATTSSTDYSNGDLTLTLPASPTQGNTLIVAVAQIWAISSGVQSISTDSGKLQWTPAVIKNSPVTLPVTLEIWSGYVSAPNASRVITINLKTTTKPASAIIQEYNGITSSSAVDRTQTNSGVSSNPSTGNTSLQTSHDYEVWIGAMSLKNATASYSSVANWREVSEAGGGSGTSGEKLVFEEKIVQTRGIAGVTAAADRSAAWTGAIATFMAPLLPPPPCPGGSCVTQTCNLTSNNVCPAFEDVCQKTLARSCQSNGAPCEIPQDCPLWASAGHCSITTATLCNPATPTAGCPGGQVCVPGDKCLNGTQQTPTASVTLLTGTAPPPLTTSFPYDQNVLPPPQGFRAWGPQNGSFDMHDIYLNWCAEPTDTTQRVMPTVTEYVVYRSKVSGGPYDVLAHLSPACLDTNNRCEILDPLDPRLPPGSTAYACINNDNTKNPNCSLISPPTPSACGGAGQKPCAIVDLTFEGFHNRCWPSHLQNSTYYNYFYVVTAKGQLGQNPVTESMPSFENEGWLNYCSPANATCCGGTCDINQPGCCDNYKSCDERRDPDGNGTALVCGDGHVELRIDPDLFVPGSNFTPAVLPGKDPIFAGLAPYRSVGAKPGIGSVPIAYNPPSSFVFYHLDHLGSPRVVVDEQGSVKATHHYLPFGDERPSQSDPTLNTRAFTGHERDKESGLDYMVARYYSSSLGRFMAVDPVGDISPEDPQSWNSFAYTRNNPVAYTDPSGTSMCVGSVSCFGYGTGSSNDVGAEAGTDGARDAVAERREDFALISRLESAEVQEAGVGGALSVFARALARGGRPAAMRAAIALARTSAGARFLTATGLSGLVGGIVQGPYGTAARASLQQAASAGGPVVQGFTRLTQSPQVGQAIHTWIGGGAQALARGAPIQGQVYSAQIPQGLVSELIRIGLAQPSATQMGNVVGTELKFLPAAYEFVGPLFKAVP